MHVTKNHPKALLKLMRSHQWIKNSFVFVGLFFSGRWHDLPLAWDVTLAAIAFCLVSSGVYIFNDIMDVEMDRLHPEKKKRPLAADKVTVTAASILMGLISTLGLLIGYYVSLTLLAILTFYTFINYLYTIKLKQVVILDVFTIALGFLLRIFGGTIGVGILASKWLILCGIMISLFLGFGKRRAEMDIAGSTNGCTRNVCKEYSGQLLDMFISISAGATILTYALYTVDPSTISLHKTNSLIYTLPFVMYGIFRYLYNIHNGGFGGSPSKDLYTDYHLVATAILWIILVILIIK